MQKQYIALALIATLLAVGIGQAYAVSTITGKVKTGSTGINDVKVTAEKSSEYKWTRTNSNGDYSVTVDTTNSYTVQSSKTGHTRDSTTVNGGSVSPDHILGTRSLLDIKFKVAYDTTTGITLSQAKSYLLSGEGWFLEEHSIDFIETTASSTWTSSGAATDCASLGTEMKNDATWSSGNYGTAEMLIGFTGVAMSDAYGCINAIPSAGSTHPYIVISTSSLDMSRTVMHETSHAYGLTHTSGLTCGSQIPGIMASSCSNSIYIKNWTPTDDQTVESRRLWY